MPTPKVYDRMCEERDKLQGKLERREDEIRLLRHALIPFVNAHKTLELTIGSVENPRPRFSFNQDELAYARFIYDQTGAE